MGKSASEISGNCAFAFLRYRAGDEHLLQRLYSTQISEADAQETKGFSCWTFSFGQAYQPALFREGNRHGLELSNETAAIFNGGWSRLRRVEYPGDVDSVIPEPRRASRPGTWGAGSSLSEREPFHSDKLWRSACWSNSGPSGEDAGSLPDRSLSDLCKASKIRLMKTLFDVSGSRQTSPGTCL